GDGIRRAPSSRRQSRKRARAGRSARAIRAGFTDAHLLTPSSPQRPSARSVNRALVFDDTTAASVLGGIACLVRSLHEGGHVADRPPHARQTDTRADMEGLARTHEVELSHRGAQRRRDVHRVVAAATTQDHCELVAADTEDVILRTQAATQ
ncbi:hypothetical protein RZS08_14075, partial [Arthrospira platensis SPKY1]|nr:hypothetical protein [Arthrospira platensis SPKY1]